MNINTFCGQPPCFIEFRVKEEEGREGRLKAKGVSRAAKVIRCDQTNGRCKVEGNRTYGEGNI
jgi:hypothetical protein